MNFVMHEILVLDLVEETNLLANYSHEDWYIIGNCNNATFQTPNQELRMILSNIYYINFTELSVK